MFKTCGRKWLYLLYFWIYGQLNTGYNWLAKRLSLNISQCWQARPVHLLWVYYVPPLLLYPLYYYTPFTIIPPLLLYPLWYTFYKPLSCTRSVHSGRRRRPKAAASGRSFSGIKTHRKSFSRFIFSSKHSNLMSKMTGIKNSYVEIFKKFA